MSAYKFKLRHIVLTFLACCFLSQQLFAQDLVELVKKIRPATVKIYATNVDGEKGVGSGFFINDNGEVVTNYHVIKYKTYDIEIETNNRQLYPVKYIIAYDMNADIAILKVNIPLSPAFIKISEKLPAVGERIIVLGSPIGLEQTVSEGIVAAIRDIPAGLTMKIDKRIQITAPISPGSSGGPVVNFHGEAIAVVVSGIDAGQNLNFAIPGSRVLQVVESGQRNNMTAKDMENIQELISRIMKLNYDRHHEEALKIAKEIMNQYPADFQGYFYAGIAYDGMKNFSEAETYYRKAVKRAPDHASVYGELGYSLFAQRITSPNKLDEAFQCWERAIQCDITNPLPYFYIAFAKLQLDDVATAVKYARLLRQHDKSGKLYRELMQEFKRHGVKINGH